MLTVLSHQKLVSDLFFGKKMETPLCQDPESKFSQIVPYIFGKLYTDVKKARNGMMKGFMSALWKMNMEQY